MDIKRVVRVYFPCDFRIYVCLFWERGGCGFIFVERGEEVRVEGEKGDII